MSNQLEALKNCGTVIVVDSGDIKALGALKVTDATTNPSLLLQAANLPEYKSLFASSLKYASAAHPGDKDKLVELACDKFAVDVGAEILKVIPGRISTEIDAKLSFDTAGSVKKAKELIALYREAGVDTSRVLIKLATTWEGVRAAEQLEKEGIHCNLTLVFSIVQAVACAQAGVTLISPFVGRILDWHKMNNERNKNNITYLPHEDPGVVNVTQIYNYFKAHGYKTQVMGASFRNKDEITELAGCDLLTISPKLISELHASHDPVEHKLSAQKALSMPKPAAMDLSESNFRFLLNNDAMGTEKLAEGIRNFFQDRLKLEDLVKSQL